MAAFHRQRMLYLDLDVLIMASLDELAAHKGSFRRSCREGVYGSCAMNIDGTNTLGSVVEMVRPRHDWRIRGDSQLTWRSRPIFSNCLLLRLWMLLSRHSYLPRAGARIAVRQIPGGNWRLAGASRIK
jgi:hypothetical protein